MNCPPAPPLRSMLIFTKAGSCGQIGTVALMTCSPLIGGSLGVLVKQRYMYFPPAPILRSWGSLVYPGGVAASGPSITCIKNEA